MLPMENTPYCFYKYDMYENEASLGVSQQWDLLINNIGREVAYRKADPSDFDKDTSIITPDHTQVKTNYSNVPFFHVLYFSIAKHITTRQANVYDKKQDLLKKEEFSTDEYVIGSIYMVPAVGLLAVADRSTQENLNATTTASRFATIVKSIPNHTINITPASSYDFLQSALSSWDLEEFTYSACPFNPSVSTPGDKIHSLIDQDNARIIGKAKPNKGKHLNYSDDGWIKEVTGLAEKGYGEYGATGTTQQGYHARIQKSDPKASKPPKIKVYIPPKQTSEEHAKAVAMTLLEIYE